VAARGGTRPVHEWLLHGRVVTESMTERVRFLEFLLTEGGTNRAQGGEEQLAQRHDQGHIRTVNFNKMSANKREQKG
jgi:hypothetical protein